MLLSIITINYNNITGLKKTIQSVISQTNKGFEFIVVDGGSTDGSKGLLNEHAYSITYSISEKDNGIYDAMNKGIEKSNGQYLLFLNSGDYLNDATVLEKAFPLLNSGEDIVACSYKMEGSNAIEESPREARFSSFWYKSICHQAAFIKKDLFAKHGLYDTSWKIAADWEFFVRTIFLHQASYTSSSILLAVIENDGLSSRGDTYKITQEERASVYAKLFPGFMGDYKRLKDFDNSPLHKWVNKLRKAIRRKG